MMDVEMLIKTVMDCSGRIRRCLGPGYLESVYKNAMLVELKKQGLSYEIEKPISVFYDNVLVGDFKADIITSLQLVLMMAFSLILVLRNYNLSANIVSIASVSHNLLLKSVSLLICL